MVSKLSESIDHDIRHPGDESLALAQFQRCDLPAISTACRDELPGHHVCAKMQVLHVESLDDRLCLPSKHGTIALLVCVGMSANWKLKTFKPGNQSRDLTSEAKRANKYTMSQNVCARPCPR